MATKPKTKAAGKPPRKVSGAAIKNKGGRPLKLIPDAATIKQINGLGMIQATTREMEAVLGVSSDTLNKFLAIPEVRAALDAGKAQGTTSLRRKQLALAMAGNPTMLIWLGKNLLSQSDKVESTGKDGSALHPAETTTVVTIYDDGRNPPAPPG